MTPKISNSPNLLKRFFNSITNIPNSYSDNLQLVKNNIKDFRHKATHITESNLELGIYHLSRGNINDAIIRFLLINKIFSPQEEEVYYWLGWCYYLKNNNLKAISFLNKTNIPKAQELRDFISNIDGVKQIPENIWVKQRELTDYQANLEKLLYSSGFAVGLVKLLMKSINELPDEYRILELSYVNSFIAEELKRRMPPAMNITLIEPSLWFYEEVKESNYNHYDNILLTSTTDFFKTNTNKFDIIFSCAGINFVKDLSELFLQAYNNLEQLGYFAVVLLSEETINQDAYFSTKKREYVYNHTLLKILFEQTGFNIIYAGKLPLGNNNNYSIIIGQKTL